MISYDVSLFGINLLFFIFFFFKQKTAYEMRISDWSSDVCSSDLAKSRTGGQWHECSGPRRPGTIARRPVGRRARDLPRGEGRAACEDRQGSGQPCGTGARRGAAPGLPAGCHAMKQIHSRRSEEHTSELQSLMRISNAVYLSKTKKILNM